MHFWESFLLHLPTEITEYLVVFCSLFLWRNWWSIFFVFIKFCPLIFAAGNDKRNTILKLFLSIDGVDIDLLSPNWKWTSLFSAIRNLASKNTTTLLWHGASINISCYGKHRTPKQHLRGKIAKLLRQWMRMRKFDFLFEKIFILFLFVSFF